MAEPTQKMAYHIDTGATLMYATDANSAVARFPYEWSLAPWSAEDAEAARQALKDKQEAEAIMANGQPAPTPEEQAAIDQYNTEVTAARERLDAYRKEQADKNAKAAQVEADQALIDQGPPVPDPTARRPVGRPKAKKPDKAADKT